MNLTLNYNSYDWHFIQGRMEKLYILIAFLLLVSITYQIGKKYAVARSSDSSISYNGISGRKLHSLPKYYGYCAVLWTVIPAALILVFISLFNSNLISFGLLSVNPYILPLIILSFVFMAAGITFLKPALDARKHYESWVKNIFILFTAISVSITVFIFFSVLIESIKFFGKVNFFDFIFGLEWSPQTALRADQAGSSGKFGIIPVFLGTFLITFIAMCISIPFGLMSAIYFSEYAKPRFRNIMKPILEILAGIPTVVYGYFAALTMGPLLKNFMAHFGIEMATESALVAGLVMGIMIIPFIMSLSDDVMNAVPRSLRDASLGLGATKSETVKKVVIPAALPGIMGAFLLAVSRAIGETMIVVMAAGLIGTLTINPLSSVTTVTAQIVKLLVGDQEFDSAKTLAAFALSLTLFLVTLVLNIAAIIIVKKYRERYE